MRDASFYIDDVLAGVSLIDLYAATGEGKYKAGADKMAQYLFRMEKSQRMRREVSRTALPKKRLYFCQMAWGWQGLSL